ncbi:hypothetical protein ACRRTK_013089 [Alexandromys fortis]
MLSSEWLSAESQTPDSGQVMGLGTSVGWGSVCTKSGREEDGGETDSFEKGYSPAAT